MTEDYPTKPKSLSKVRFSVRLKSSEDPIVVEGTGLRANAETVEIFGDTQIIAAFAVSEIIGIWPQEPKP